jgi:hypothetical protein
LPIEGRKSGRTYTTPVNYVRRGDVVLLTTSHRWWKNPRDDAPVRARIKGKDYEGVAVVETSEEAVIEAIDTILGEQPGYGKWIGVKPGPDGRADREQAVREGMVAVRIELAV